MSCCRAAEARPAANGGRPANDTDRPADAEAGGAGAADRHPAGTAAGTGWNAEHTAAGERAGSAKWERSGQRLRRLQCRQRNKTSRAQQPSLPTAAQAAAVQPQQLEQSTQQEAGLPTPQQVQTEQTATPLERLETMGVSGKRAQSMARGIEAFYRGQITDGEVLSKLLSFPEVQNVMRQMTDADIEAVVSGNVQAQNQQPVNAAVQQVPGSQQPGVQNEATTPEGGMNNGTEQLPAGQQPGAEQQGEQLPDGDGGRILRESTGGQSGILAEGRPQRAFNQGRTAVERENLGRTLRLEK